MTDNRPSKKQRELLSFIDGFIKGNGYGPSYREVMRALDYKSVSTVAVHVDGLIERGFLIKKDNSARSLEVVNDATNPVQNEVTKTHQAWLVAAIEKRLTEYEQSGDVTLRDDVTILIETLRVMKLPKEYATLRARFDEYHKNQ